MLDFVAQLKVKILEGIEDAAFDGDVHAVVPYDASFTNVPPLFGP